MTVMLVVLAVLVLVVLALIIAQGTRTRDLIPPQPVDIDWGALQDVEFLAALERGKKIEAIKIYRERTGLGLKDAKDAVEYLQTQQQQPDWLDRLSTLDQVDAALRGVAQVYSVNDRDEAGAVRKPKQSPAMELAAGIRDMLEEGRKDEAVEVYQKFAGVDLYTAKDAVDEIERTMRLADQPGNAALSAADEAELRDLVARGNTIAAVKLYRERTGLGLKESKDAVDTLLRGS